MALESRLGSRIVLGCSTAWGGGGGSRVPEPRRRPPPPPRGARPAQGVMLGVSPEGEAVAPARLAQTPNRAKPSVFGL